MADKKILQKISQSDDFNSFKIQLNKLAALPQTEFIYTQLVGIAELKHPFAEYIFQYLVCNNALQFLVKRVISAKSTVEDSLPYFLISQKIDKQFLVEIALTSTDFLEFIFATKSDSDLFDMIALKLSQKQLLQNATKLIAKISNKITSEIWTKIKQINPTDQEIFNLTSLIKYCENQPSLLLDTTFKTCELILQNLESPRYLIRLLASHLESRPCPSIAKPFLDMFKDFIKVYLHINLQFQNTNDSETQIINQYVNLSMLPFQLLDNFDIIKSLHSVQCSKTKMEIFHFQQIMQCFRLQPSLQTFQEVLKIENLPFVHEFIQVDLFDNLKNEAELYQCVILLIQKGRYSGSKASTALILNIISRNLKSLLMLSAFTEFCLIKLDNKFFRIHQDLIEDYLANQAKSELEVMFIVGLIRKIAQHPKTSYSTNYIELLQSILVSCSQKDLCFTVLADMVNNGVLQFSITYQILIKKLPASALKGQGWLKLLESCKQEIYDLELNNRFYTFIEMDAESQEIFKVCCDVNRVVFDKLLLTDDPKLLKDHAEYILNQGLQAKVVKESIDNVNARVQALQSDLWHKFYKIYLETQDASWLAELLRIDLKQKTESKYLRSLKFDEKTQLWQDLTKSQVVSLINKQAVSFQKLKLFGIYTMAVTDCLAGKVSEDSVIQALLMLSIPDLQKLEVVPFVSLYKNKADTLLNYLSVNDNQSVALLITKPELIKTPQLFEKVVIELVQYYLKQNTQIVSQKLVEIFKLKKGQVSYIEKVIDVLQSDKSIILRNAIKSSQIYESLGTDVQSMLQRERLAILMDIEESYSNLSTPLRFMWRSHWSQAFEIDIAISSVKNILGENLVICAAIHAYLLRQRSEQTYSMYLDSMAKESNKPQVSKFGYRFRNLFLQKPDLTLCIESMEKMIKALQ